MRPDRKTGKHGFADLMRVGLFASAAVLCTGQAVAQSAYDCRGLETHAALPAVEGKDGTFFSIKPELQAHHGLADETITLLSSLDSALEARGTTLVLLPVPTRAQVLSHQLPPMAGYLGYDPAQSIAVHIDMIGRLTAASIAVADPLRDLRTAALSGAKPFFETDPRPTPAGARVLAKAVAEALAQHPNLADVTRRNFSSAQGAGVALTSSMRIQLQTACQSELPAVIAQSFTTSREAEGAANALTGLAAGQQDTLVLLGTGTTATTALNLPGFISEATGIETLSYGVANGGAFAAISSYLTSADFQAAPPRVLVWEMPVSASMAAHGDQPLRELVAAATNTCPGNLAMMRTPEGDRLRVDLSRIPLSADMTLQLDTGGAELQFVRFRFTDAAGLTRTRSIYRHPGQLLTGRFYLPFSGMETTGLSSVEIEGASAFGLQSRLSICS